MSLLFKSFQASDGDTSPEPQSHSSSEFAAVNPSEKENNSVLNRQLRAVANFLAPPPSSMAVASSASDSSSSFTSKALLGVRNDLAEISGSLRTGLSLLSVNSNKAVGNISRFASNLLPFQNHSISADDHEEEEDDDEESEYEDEDEVPGITDEVLNFVSDISSRPEYWTEFPLALDDRDFKMSDVQKEHASTVEQLVPKVSALKLKLQSFMNEKTFWMIYFILLLPRINENDFELLSTSEIIEARDIILEKLRSKENTQVNSEHNCANNLVCGSQEGPMPSGEERNSVRVIRGGEGLQIENGENTDHRFEKVGTETSRDAKERLALEDITFSDIENDESDLSSKFFSPKLAIDSSPSESGEWVRLHGNSGQKGGKQEKYSSGEESSDWLDVNDSD